MGVINHGLRHKNSGLVGVACTPSWAVVVHHAEMDDIQGLRRVLRPHQPLRSLRAI